MPGAPKMNGPNYGLTPRELELTVKAMITMVENNVKPDFEKLAKMANFQNANAAGKMWWHVNRKLKTISKNADGETDIDNKAGGKKQGKHQADDMPKAPPAKRGRKRKTLQDAAEEGEDEEQKLVAKGDADEIRGSN